MSAVRPEIGGQQLQQLEPAAAPSLVTLFTAFFRLGASAFGGPAMVAYIREMAVGGKGWLSARTFDDGVALCQAVPGATAMQTAAYVGLRVRGAAGAATAFVGFGLPAFGLMLALSAAYSRTHDLQWIVWAFAGLQAVVVAIVGNATLMFGKSTLNHWRKAPITALAVALFGLGLNPFVVVVLSALLGLWLVGDQASGGATETVPGSIPHTTRPVIAILCVAAALLAGLFLLNQPLAELASIMIQIDLFAFGGGFASVPLLFTEVVSVRHWLDGPTLLDGIVLGQITPGPIVITATFVGFLRHGIIGAVVATVGVFLPSFLVVVAAAPYFDRLRTSPVFARLIGGALCSFPGLLLVMTVQFARSVAWDVPRVLLAVAAFTALRLGANILWVVLIAAAISLLCGR